MTYDENSPWIWRKASITDCGAMSQTAYNDIRQEIDHLFTPSVRTYEYNLINDVVKQYYNPQLAFVIVAEEKATKQILAYSWATRDFTVWSNDPMLNIKIAQLSPTLSLRKRFVLLEQMIDQWEIYCKLYDIKVIASSSVRREQRGFLRCHENKGFTIHGSMAYKKINSK